MKGSGVRFPEVSVRLVGTDGNAFAVLGKVRSALKKGGATADDLTAFMADATSGDYGHLLAVCMRWVNVS